MLNGVSIVYVRGATRIPLRAVQGSSAWDEVDVATLATTAAKRHDWLFKADDIAALGTPVEGDIIEHADGSLIRQHGVMRGAPGEQPWRYMDRGFKWMRVHTVQTGTTGS